MMQKFIPVFIFISALFLFLDVYCLKNWTEFTKKRNWPPLTYKAPWAVAYAMFILSLLNYTFFAFWLFIGLFQKILYTAIAIWYLPKIAISGFLLLKGLVLFLRKKIFDKTPAGSSSLLTDEPGASGISRRKALQNIGWGLSAVPFLLVANGTFRARYDFRTLEEEIPIYNLPEAFDGLRIVHVSDIHAGSFYSGAPMRQVCDIINGLGPDVAVFTGDFVNFHPDEMDIVSEELRRVEAGLGKFGCLGNHDHYMDGANHEELKRRIGDAGIELLTNRNVTIDAGNGALQLAGVDNSSWNNNYADFSKAMNGLSAAYPTILLCHDPSNWDKNIRRKIDAALTLSGHTHGGQVAVELFGKSYSPVSVVYKQWAGLYADRSQYLYINRGLGSVGPPVRIGAPPEITLVKLVKAENIA